MKNQIISLSLAAVLLTGQGAGFAASNYTFEPAVQNVPSYQGGYQTQYPMPVNNNYQYQTPQYDYNNGSYNNYNNTYSSYGYNDRLQGSVVMVPANTLFSAVLMTPLSSNSSQLGDSVTMYLPSDFYYGNNLIAGAGSKINGSVVKVKKGGFGNRNGQLQIKFNSLITPSGQVIPIAASIQTNDGTGILKAGTAADVTKEYTKKAAIGAAAGAVSGVILGALSGGKVGKGAVYGTAVGGGMGLIQPVFERGGNVELPQNAQFDIVLNQPVTVSSNTLY